MSYMAKYQGTIQFKNHLYITEKRNITEYLKKNTFLNNIECPKDNIIRFKGDCNYDEDTIIQQLNALLKSKEITSGTVEFEGESDDYWRLVLKNNEWIEQYGEKTITYKDDDEPIIRNFNDKIHVEYHDCIYIYYPTTNNVTELSKFDGHEMPCAIQEIANKIRQICNESKHKLYELVIDGGNFCYFTSSRPLTENEIEQIDDLCKKIDKTTYDIKTLFTKLKTNIKAKFGVDINATQNIHIFRIKK